MTAQLRLKLPLDLANLLSPCPQHHQFPREPQKFILINPRHRPQKLHQAANQAQKGIPPYGQAFPPTIHRPSVLFMTSSIAYGQAATISCPTCATAGRNRLKERVMAKSPHPSTKIMLTPSSNISRSTVLGVSSSPSCTSSVKSTARYS